MFTFRSSNSPEEGKHVIRQRYKLPVRNFDTGESLGSHGDSHEDGCLRNVWPCGLQTLHSPGTEPDLKRVECSSQWTLNFSPRIHFSVTFLHLCQSFKMSFPARFCTRFLVGYSTQLCDFWIHVVFKSANSSVVFIVKVVILVLFESEDFRSTPNQLRQDLVSKSWLGPFKSALI